MDFDSAITELADMVAATSEPTLGDREVEALLANAARPDAVGNPPTNVATASGWASGAVLAGAVIVEGTRYWRCLSPGTTGSTEPSWPTFLAGTGGPSSTTVADGDVVWVDNGTAWAPTWDLNSAAAAGWERKASKAATMFDFMTGDQQFMRSQVPGACREQARVYRNKIVGSALIGRG